MMLCQLRSFINGYLPAAVKMLHSYRTMSERVVSEEQAANLRGTVLHSMYQDEPPDVSVELSVPETSLRLDGLLDNELTLPVNLNFGPDREDRESVPEQAADSQPLLPHWNKSTSRLRLQHTNCGRRPFS